MSTLPEPPVPADADLQDFPFMPLHVARLRDSDLAAEEEPEACWYAVLLWAASWHQLPAGSLPDNDTVLMRLVGLGRDKKTWQRNRSGALRGFVQCSDGRFYHPVVCEQVNEAWDSKVRQRHRTFCAAVRKHNERKPKHRLETPAFDQWIELGRPQRLDEVVTRLPTATADDVTRDNRERHAPVECETPSKRQGQGQGQGQGYTYSSVGTGVPTGAEAPEGPGRVVPDGPTATAVDLTKAVFDIGLAILRPVTPNEPKARKILGSWRQKFGDGAVVAVLARCEIERPSDPIGWITAALKSEQRKAASNGSATVASVYRLPAADAGNLAAGFQRRAAEARSREPAGPAGRPGPGEADAPRQLPVAPARALP
ncbi:DUF1376 domain-containing protein [Novosphingobium sp. PhB165]|uniref:DUF1376 domain-containing protein n=1 Tax=Novosphingobium sp. PhB165 TaxID=2485105 RepID=UPI0010493449|nr:DUF1376 domain-containing protein [Novosphingobium sp. PhB165]